MRDLPFTPAATSEAEGASPDTADTLDRKARVMRAKMAGGLSPFALGSALADWGYHLAASPGAQMKLAEHAMENAAKLAAFAQKGGTAPFTPGPNDHRFTHPDWAKPPFALWQQSFLAACDWWQAASDPLPGMKPRNAARVAAMAEFALNAAAPVNTPALNPEVLESWRSNAGSDQWRGFTNWLNDLSALAAEAPPQPSARHRVGETIACTPGKVVYRNPLFELIQYAPQTETVHPEPILIVPAWIMKYYILDLSPENSLINWLVGQGHTVFAISWVNPGPEMSEVTLDDYRKQGVMAAMDEVTRICGDTPIHACGYCLGGTILSIAAATMARDGDRRLASLTLLAAQTDFTEAGDILLFIDDSELAAIEAMMEEQGTLDGKQMAGSFAMIRSEDQIWGRMVQRYQLGRDDPDLDILAWNADTTRMPARMHAQYLRALFMENRLSGGRFAVDGRAIALKNISSPLFVVGTEKDHIAPWHSVYKIRLFSDADMEFVLTSGGHNGGIISPPGHPKRHYRKASFGADDLYEAPNDVVSGLPFEAGSWWAEWGRWLRAQSSDAKSISPPTSDTDLGPAPGSYVMQR